MSFTFYHYKVINTYVENVVLKEKKWRSQRKLLIISPHSATYKAQATKFSSDWAASTYTIKECEKLLGSSSETSHCNFIPVAEDFHVFLLGLGDPSKLTRAGLDCYSWVETPPVAELLEPDLLMKPGKQ